MTEAVVGPVAWAVVEIMGHRRLAGRVSQERLCDKAMLKIEIPVGVDADGGDIFAVEYYAPESMFSICPCSEEQARLEAESGYCSAPRLGTTTSEAEQALPRLLMSGGGDPVTAIPLHDQDTDEPDERG